MNKLKSLDDASLLFSAWDHKRGMHNQDHRLVLLGQLGKMAEEVGELAKNINRGNLDAVRDDIGDCMKVLNGIADLTGHNLLECAEHTWNEIKDRNGQFIGGVYVKEEDIEKIEITGVAT